MLLNILDYVANNFYMEFILRHGLIDFLFNGVAFISNMESVLMGEIAFTSGDLNDSYNNVKAEDWLKSESNFKIIMMEYIGNDYYHFNNVSEAHIFNINNLTQFISMVFISIESFLLGFQKISYEIFGYVFDLCNWYINYKILLDKTIITSNLVEDYCYNISLELLAEVQSENIKLLWLLSENGDLRLKNSLYINLLKNYYQILKENPYKLNFELMRLYKSHLKLNILSYGMDFDINVVKSKKYFLSFFDLNVSNYGKLNTLNISYDAFDSYKISNYKIIDKTQKYYKNMMLSTDIETSIFAKKIINVDDKYNAIILNRFKESHLWFTQKNFIFFQTQSQINKPEWYTMFGGYSYWWGWHQDAVYIHGKKGPGGAPLWDDYIRWKISKKYKLFITYVPKHIKKIKHGVRLYNYYPGRITKRFTMFHFDWDYKKKKKFIKYIVHGRRVWEIERLFFKRFIWSSDIWLKVLNGQGGGNPAYYWENIESSTIREKFMYELERSGVVGVYDKVHYVKFGTNSPECVFKNKSSKFRSHYWWFAYMDNDREVTRHIKWKKSKMYEHIFSVLEHYYNLSLKMHDESMAGIRGFILKQFALDFWFAKDKLMLMNYLNDNQITWETFYTNIESVTEPLNLNYINKNFYGRHLTNKMDIFLVKHADIPTDVQLPKSTNLLLKKAYIENLIYVYQKEDEPMVNYIKYRTIPTDLYIWFRCKLDWAYIVLLRVIDAYLDLLGFIGEDITKSLMKIKQYRLLKEYHNTYKDNYKYALILFICVLYSIVCGVLMTLVRSFLPKNLVYGIRTYTKSNWKTAIRDFFESINNIVGWDNHRKYHGYIEATLVHLDKISKLLNIKDTAEREDSYKKDFNAEDKLKWRKTKLFLNKTESEVENNTNVLNWAAIEERTLNKINEESLYLRKNFFDAEQRYIYSWEKRFDKTYEDKVEDSTLERRYQFDWVPERAYSNIDKKKNELIQRNYAIFYKKLISEINLEKWENNTKIRADILLWAKYLGVSAYGLIRGLFLYYRDRRFNHNRIILWDDPLLEKESKVTYYFKVPKLFFNFFFIIKFTIGAIQLWDWNFWVRRWTQFVLYGVHARVSYKNLRKHLEKEWTLEWYKESADYGAGLFYKDYSKVVKKFQDIKNTPDDRRGFVYENKRADMISKILNLTFEDSKYDEMLAYRLTMLNIQESRKINSFDHKFKDIRIKLVLDVGKLTPKQWAEQKIMYKYVDEVYEKKLALEKEEYSDIKQSYTSRTYRDMEDEEKTLVFLEWEHQKHVQSIMKSKLSSVAYEKKLREFNYENKIVDAALDRKERVFFESIPEYKQDLQKEYNKIAEKEELQKAEDSAYERKSRLLYGVLEEHYLAYRWYTTMGARLNFLLSQIMGIFVGWLENIGKVRRNEYSVLSLFVIMYTDAAEFIYKMYWEYLVIWNRQKALKNLGRSLFDVLKFSLILTPIIFYTGSLYLLLFLYLIFKNSIKQVYIKLPFNWLKKKYLNFSLNVSLWFNVLFRDLNTGLSIFDQLYIWFYKLCALTQRNLYFIHGAFILGYREKGLICGFNKVLHLFKLQYKAFMEQKQAVSLRNILDDIKSRFALLSEVKSDMAIKFRILLVLMDADRKILRFRKRCVIALYQYIIKPIFKVDFELFHKLYIENTVLLKRYYTIYWENLYMLMDIVWKLNFFEFIKLFIKWIFIILTMPFRFVINHQKWKYITNYKQGIQGFRDNPMRIIINRPRKKKDWRVKLHFLLMHNIISLRLQDLRWRRDSLLEIFLMYKVEEVKWTNKNTFQDHFWKSLYWNVKTMKENALDFLITYMEEIEEGYKSFETTVENKNFSYWERILYSYRMYKLLKNSEGFKIQKKISRDLIFFKKVRDRRKLMRIYFLKGIINWITYVTINKVFFTKVENKFRHKRLRHRGLTNRHIRYKSRKLDKTLHLPYYITYTPPQFWSLVILYDAYFRHILRYYYEDFTFPLDWDNDFQHDRRYKWRLAAPEHVYEIPYVDRWKIAIDINNFKYDSFVNNLAKAPFDPMLRWTLFLLEFGFSFEDIMSDGKDIWGDISVTHLLTYNQFLDSYEYEIKDYNRLIKGFSFFRIAENSFDKDSKAYYEERYAMVSKNLAIKNKNVLQSVLEKRRLKSAEILHKALLRNVAMTAQERDAEMEELKEKDYFYSKKRELFDEMGIEHYMDWKAQYDSKIIEDKYFNTFNMDDLTFAVKREEESFNKYGMLNPVMRYMVDNIILKSYDQTLEDLSYFLKFKAWKILDKKKCKKVINYKNLYIKPSFIKRITYYEFKDIYETVSVKKTIKEDKIIEELESEEEEELESEEEEEKVSTLKYKYWDLGPLEWELTKTEPLYGFVENNYFSLYRETGTLYTYQEKIEYNEGAKNYNKLDVLFHGNETLLAYSKIIRDRAIGLKDLKKITVRKGRKWNIKHIVTLAYVNNIRWSWEQWLGYGDTRIEDDILQNNIILLNEKFSIWNLRRCPMRIKMPLALVVSEVAALDFFKDSQNYISMYEHHFYLLGAIGVAPLIRDSLRWWQAKSHLETRFNKNITDLIFWVFRASAFDAEVNKIKEDHAYVLKNFIRNFQTYNKLYFIGMQYYTWDLIRYNDIWVGVDEFPFHRYWKLKQLEFLTHDPAAATIVQRVHNLGYSRFKPGNFVFFFKNQYSATFLYNFYGLLSLGSFLWVLKVLFYHPGEYLAAYYMLMVPIYLWITFWYLRRCLVDGKDVSEAAQLYLYRFHKSKSYFEYEWDQMMYAKKQELIEKDNFFMDDEKKMKMYGTLIPQVSVEKNEAWWRNYTHLDKDNKHYNYKHVRYILFVISIHILVEYWFTQQFRFRNSKIFWDFYRLDEQMFLLISQSGDYAPRHWHERQWYMDSFWRLEGGGNLFSRWYENFYRYRQGRELVEMDYGYDWQKVKNLDLTLYYNPQTVIHIPTSYSDASWVDFCRLLRIYIPDELKAGGGVFKDNGTWAYAVTKKRLKWREFSERGLSEEEIARKRTYELYGDDGMNTFQHLYFAIKKVFREILIEQYLGIQYTQKYNPLQHWFDFQKLILDEYNYDLTGEDYMSFIFESRLKTEVILKKDFQRYYRQNDNDIVEYMQPLMQKKEMFLMKKASFEKGTSLDLKTLLSVSEHEKHLNVLYHNFFQYKLKRLDLLLKSENWQFIDASNIVNDAEIIERNNQIQEILDNKSEAALYLQKCEQYIMKIFKNIAYEDKLDYKCNLLLKLWNEKQWSWWIIKDVYNSSNLLEILDILIKFINKVI